MAYMTDVEKIKYLAENNYFNQIKATEYIPKKIKFQKNKINKIIKAEVVYQLVIRKFNPNLENIEDFRIVLDEWINTAEYYNDNKSNKDGSAVKISHDNVIKKYIDNFYIEDKETATECIEHYTAVHKFLNQQIIKPGDNEPSKYFITNEYPKLNIVKEAINKFTNINCNALEAKTQDEFESLLVLNQEEESLEFPEKFDKFKLKKILRNNDLNNDLVVLSDFDKYIEIPDFIDESILEENRLKKTLFIEGISGSGKTILAQSIAFNISSINSYYIDLTKLTDDDFDIDKKNDLNDLELLIKILSRYKATIILDNIHHTNSTREITNKILEYSNNIYFETSLKIILVAQYDIENIEEKEQTYFDIFFDKSDNNVLKELICHIELSNKNNLYKIRYSMINNFLNYYKKKGTLPNDETSLITIKNIEEKFGCLLVYLKYAIEYTKNLNTIEPKHARQILKKKYSLMLDVKENNKFKLILSYYASNNIPFKIDKDSYIDNYNNEVDFIELMLEEKLIYKLDFENYFILSFPHNAIPRLVLSILEKRGKIDTEAIIFNNLSYMYELDSKLLISYIDHLIKDQNVYILDSAIQELQRLNIDLKTIFTAKRLLQTVGVLNLGLVEIKFVKYIENIITPSDLDFKNLSFEDLLNTFRMVEHTSSISNFTIKFINEYISNKNILFTNLEFTSEMLKYYSYNMYCEPEKNISETFNALIDTISNNESLFIKKLSSQYNFNMLKNIFIVENDILTSLMSENLFNILNKEKVSLETSLRNIKLLYDLHNNITYSNLFIDIINQIVLEKIDHDKLTNDLKEISDYNILTNLFAIEYLSKKDTYVLDLLDTIYGSLIELDEQKYLVTVLRSVFNNSLTPFTDYIDIVHNLHLIHGFEHKTHIIDIINLDLNIPEYIIHNEDTFNFIKNKDIKLLDDLKKKIIRKVAKSISYIRVPLDTNKYKILLDYSKNNSKTDLNTIFNQLEQNMSEKLSKTTCKNIDFKEVFEFFTLANLYNKNVDLIFKDFIELLNTDYDNSEHLYSLLTPVISMHIELFNNFLIYLQNHREERIIFIKFFINSISTNKLRLIYVYNIRVNPMNLSLMLCYINTFDSNNIINSLDLNTDNIEREFTLSDKLAQYVLFDILKKEIPKIEDTEELSQYKKVVYSAIEDINIPTINKFLYLKGLLLISNNKEFINKLKRDDIITNFKGEDYKDNRKELHKIQKIICDRIKKDFVNLKFTE